MERLGIIVYSDFLCPWCYNVTVRMRRLEKEFGDRIDLQWRAYLLRPTHREPRDLERFRSYTQGWRRPGEEEDAGIFQPWTGDSPPPTHSIPAHIAAKAAKELGHEQSRQLHDRLLRAYFAESRDISSAEVLQELWNKLDLPASTFPDIEDPAQQEVVLGEHRDAVELGLTGVPAARLADNPAFVTGALPYAMYQRWVERHL